MSEFIRKIKDWVDDLEEVGEIFSLGEIIGKGNTGTVYKGTNQNGDHYAIKVHKDIESRAASIYTEFLILTAVKENSRFPQLFGTFRKDQEIWFVIEHCKGGSVKDLLLHLKEKQEVLPENVIAFILHQTALALHTLHDLNFLHRDIKSANILICGNGDIKLTDFDLSKSVEGMQSGTIGVIGSPCWMAPEVIVSESFPQLAYDTRADVWSLGITAIELTDWEPPFVDVFSPRAIFQTIQHPPPTLRKPLARSKLYNDFVSECLVKTADYRPWLVEILQHPLLTDGIGQETEAKETLMRLTSTFQNISRHSIYSEEVTVTSDRIRYGGRAEMVMYRDDLATLYAVSEGKVLETLKQRYAQGNIYTYLGDILLLVNPFYNYTIYGPEIATKYKSVSRCDNAPHIYGVSDRVYQDMVHHREHQHIILTGETASGKSTAANHILSYITELTSSSKRMSDRLMNVAVIMNAFGNASTLFNSNATRHISYFDLTFTKSGKLSGGVLSSYCFEKWRVTKTRTDRKESNYHIFYYLLDSLITRNELELYQLENISYNYLPPSLCHQSKDNVQKLQKIKDAFTTLGFQIEDQETVIQILAAILLIGQIAFVSEPRGCRVENTEIFQKVGKLLGIDQKKLEWALTNYCLVTMGEVIRVRTNEMEATETRDSLARNLYSRLVDWIVNLINFRLSLTRVVFGDQQSLGIIDIPGFECFLEENSFDQFQINMINEQLHFIYNQKIFVSEMEDSIVEEVNDHMSYKYHDNHELLDAVVSKPRGMLHFLDIDTKNSTDKAQIFLETMKTEFSSKFIRMSNKNDETTFRVAHYSGQVEYDAVNFKYRNRNFLSPEVIEVMRQSTNSCIVQLFTNKITKTGNLTIKITQPEGGSKLWTSAIATTHKKFNTESTGKYSQSRQMKTAGEIMRNSLLELLQKLSHGSIHFVRCIRSNLKSEPCVFDTALVKYQIRALGIVESVRLRQNGYSRRLEFSEFLNRYKFLGFDHNEKVADTKENCRLLLIRLKLEGWAMGRTKVLLKYYNEEFLSRLYEKQIQKVIKVQALLRAFLTRKRAKPKSVSNQQETLPETIQTVLEVELISPEAVKKLLSPPIPEVSRSVSPSEEPLEVIELDLDEVHPTLKEVSEQFEENDVTIGPTLSGGSFPPVFVPKKIAPKTFPSSLLKIPECSTPEIVNPIVEFIHAANRGSSQEMSSSDDTSEPFNIQAMLKKTNKNLTGEEPIPCDSILPLVLIPEESQQIYKEPKILELNPEENETKEAVTTKQNEIKSVELTPGIVVNGFVEDL